MFALAVGTLNLNIVFKIVHNYDVLNPYNVQISILKIKAMHTPIHHYYSGRTSKVGNNFQYIIHLLNTGTQNKT